MRNKKALQQILKGFKTINIFSLILFLPGVTVPQSKPIKKVRKSYRIIEPVQRFSVLYFKDLIDRQSGQSGYLP